MKQVIIIHGLPDKEEFYDVSVPSQSNRHWFPWLQKQLALRDEVCQVLEFPRPYDPVYSNWEHTIENFLIDEETILIGHSFGAGFIIRYLSEHVSINPKRVILVAPWIDPYKNTVPVFFEYTLDTRIASRTELHCFVSSDDEQEVLETSAILKREIPGMICHEFENREHFCTPEFPELLALLEDK